MNVFTNGMFLLTANASLYKWLLGGGIALMALLGLVFFGMLALQVLQQEEAPVGDAPVAEPADSPADSLADSRVEEQEGGNEENS